LVRLDPKYFWEVHLGSFPYFTLMGLNLIDEQENAHPLMNPCSIKRFFIWNSMFMQVK